MAEKTRVPARRGPVLWIVSEPYFPEEVGTAYVMTGIAEGLAPHFDVRVLCARPCYVARGTETPVREIRKGVSIRRCWSTTWDNRGLLFRLVNFLTITGSLFLHALWNVRRGDVMLVVTSPPFLPFVARVAAWFHGVRNVLLVHDVYPDAAVVAGMLGRDAWITRLLEHVSRSLYRSYDRRVVIGRDMQRLIRRKIGVRDPSERGSSDGPVADPGATSGPEDTVFIPNWAETDEIHPSPKAENRLLAELGLQDRFVVQYAGNMGLVHNIDALIDAARQLKAEPRVHFLVIGSGRKKAVLEAAVAAEGLTNVTVLNHLPRTESQNFLNACDVSLSLLVPGLSGVAVPSRTYQILAAGKPMIALCDEDSEIALVVREERVGWVVPADRPEGLTAAIRDALDHPDVVAEMGRRARRAASEKYDRDHCMQAFCRVLGDWIAERRTG